MRHSIRSDTPKRAYTAGLSARTIQRPSAEALPAKPERAILVSILLPNTTVDLRQPLAELEELSKAAGVEVIDALVQKRTAMSPRCGLGKGKVEELAERVLRHQADVVILDNDLTPSQIQNLEEELRCKVIDRSELILDIFARRAQTREAKLQVELAQLEYTAPRLRGMWQHLERIAGGGVTSAGAVGGVGTRGPGERQIEIDRRIVRDRIAHLRREIEEIQARRSREVKARTDAFTVSLVGYTNSGKSTLFSALTGAERYAADMLFATLDTKTVRWALPDHKHALLSDTVGFVRDLPHHLVASFKATLEEAVHADLLLHVVDASSPYAPQQVDAVNEVLASLGCDKLPRITLLNKMDVVTDTAAAAIIELRESRTLRISALTRQGLDALVDAVAAVLKEGATRVRLLVPHSEGRLIAEMDRLAEVLGREFRNEGVVFDVRIRREQLGQVRGRFAGVMVLDDQAEAAAATDHAP